MSVCVSIYAALVELFPGMGLNSWGDLEDGILDYCSNIYYRHYYELSGDIEDTREMTGQTFKVSSEE